MPTIRLITAVLAVPCTAVVLAAAVNAQSRFAQPPQQQTVMRYSEMDANDDGVIIRDEWRGTRPAFVAADLNGDGVLAGREIWIPVNNQSRAPGDFDLTLDGSAAAEADARGTVGTAGAADSVAVRWSQFLNLDTNRDGVVRLDEWAGNRGAFNRQDLNRDGIITRREYVGIEAAPAACVGTGAAARRQARRAPQVIRVNPQTRWTDTGIYVTAGDVLVLDSIGTTQLSDNDNDVAAPAGARSGRKAVDAPLPQELAGALIGRIGDSAPFGVGNLRLLQAPATGQLYLGVNDDHLPDNRGEFQVTITVR